MNTEDKTMTLEQKKQEFIRIYREDAEATIFDAAAQSGLGIETLTEELKKDKSFYSQAKELCGLRIKKEVMEKQKDHE